tara:strand:+ start:31 stop:312 length:282 start_codon:yes stop_codon:yes gene_type:complete
MIQLKKLADIRTNFEEADFWLTRKEGEQKIGTPVREFNKEYIGVKVTAHEKIIPDFLYYLMETVANTGYWSKFTEDEDLRVDNVKDLELQDKI